MRRDHRGVVVVTGLGVMLPGADNRQTLWRQLRTGKSQLTLEPDPTDPNAACAMGRIADFNPSAYLDAFPESWYRRYPRDVLLYLASVLRALDDAGLQREALTPGHSGLFDGTSRGSFGFWYDQTRREVDEASSDLYTRRELASCTPGQAVGIGAALLGITGPSYTFSVSCSSGAVAIGHAYRELCEGELDVAIATGHESCLVAPLYHMYADGNLLTGQRTDASLAVQPYARHSGNAFSEGAVTLVLERREHAQRRKASILATIAGYAYANNGQHPTHVDEFGKRPAQTIERVLRRSNVAEHEVGFVVGHGNGVEASDVSELRCVASTFAQRTTPVSLISTKPIYGHALGAASALNIAAAVLILHHGYVIGTANVEPDLDLPTVHVGSGRPLAATEDAGLALSFGLGGHNTAVLVRRETQAASSTL